VAYYDGGSKGILGSDSKKWKKSQVMREKRKGLGGTMRRKRRSGCEGRDKERSYEKKTLRQIEKRQPRGLEEGHREGDGKGAKRGRSKIHRGPGTSFEGDNYESLALQ